MSYRFSFFIGMALCVLGTVSCISNAHAQQIPDATKNKEFKLEYPNLPPVDQIPAQHLMEMEHVFEQCKNGKYDTAYKNCECYAMNFLARRLETPTVNPKYIHPLLKNICHDPGMIAGQHYSTCMTMHMDTAMKDWDKICSCYANYVANEAIGQNTLNYKIMRRIQKAGYRHCGFYDSN